MSSLRFTKMSTIDDHCEDLMSEISFDSKYLSSTIRFNSHSEKLRYIIKCNSDELTKNNEDTELKKLDKYLNKTLKMIESAEMTPEVMEVLASIEITTNYCSSDTYKIIENILLAILTDNAIGDSIIRTKRKLRRRLQYIDKMFIRPGPWDSDFDAYPNKHYTFDLDNGFTGLILRNLPDYVWNVYVIVPEGHFSTKDGINLTSHFQQELEDNLISRIPYDITFHDRESRRIGIDHCHGCDLAPSGRDNRLLKHLYDDTRYYTTYEMAVKEAKEIKSWLWNMCNKCGKESKSQCSICKIKYCDQTCQRADWADHKKYCKKV